MKEELTQLITIHADLPAEEVGYGDTVEVETDHNDTHVTVRVKKPNGDNLAVYVNRKTLIAALEVSQVFAGRCGSLSPEKS